MILLLVPGMDDLDDPEADGDRVDPKHALGIRQHASLGIRDPHDHAFERCPVDRIHRPTTDPNSGGEMGWSTLRNASTLSHGCHAWVAGTTGTEAQA